MRVMEKVVREAAEMMPVIGTTVVRKEGGIKMVGGDGDSPGRW